MMMMNDDDDDDDADAGDAGLVTDGGWSDWSPWSGCSVSCGQGRQSRYRACDSPPPSSAGRFCDGPVFDWRHCELLPCPGQSIRIYCNVIHSIHSFHQLVCTVMSARTHWLNQGQPVPLDPG